MPTSPDTTMHSFLFVDIVGYTAITEREGDLRAADIATTLVSTTERAAADAGAEVIKSIGDAVMVRARAAHEAIAIALRVRRELAAIPGFPAVHSGIHTGPAVCAGGDWFGHTVNLASRISDAAGPGEILCSAETLAAAGEESTARFVDCGERSFRNSTPTVGVFSAEHTPPRFSRRPAGAPLATQVA